MKKICENCEGGFLACVPSQLPKMPVHTLPTGKTAIEIPVCKFRRGA